MMGGTHVSSVLSSITTSKFPTAAWYWLTSWIDFNSAGRSRSFLPACGLNPSTFATPSPTSATTTAPASTSAMRLIVEFFPAFEPAWFRLISRSPRMFCKWSCPHFSCRCLCVAGDGGLQLARRCEHCCHDLSLRPLAFAQPNWCSANDRSFLPEAAQLERNNASSALSPDRSCEAAH